MLNSSTPGGGAIDAASSTTVGRPMQMATGKPWGPDLRQAVSVAASFYKPRGKARLVQPQQAMIRGVRSGIGIVDERNGRRCIRAAICGVVRQEGEGFEIDIRLDDFLAGRRRFLHHVPARRGETASPSLAGETPILGLPQGRQGGWVAPALPPTEKSPGRPGRPSAIPK